MCSLFSNFLLSSLPLSTHTNAHSASLKQHISSAAATLLIDSGKYLCNVFSMIWDNITKCYVSTKICDLYTEMVQGWHTVYVTTCSHQRNFIMLIFVLCKWLQDMATFTYLMKIFSTKFFFNMKVAGPGEIFVQQKFPCVQYSSVL